MADDYADNNPNDDRVEDGESLVEPLSEDNSTPFSAPTDPVDDPAADLDRREQADRLDPTHQATDSATNLDSQQLYDEGLSGAAEASEPNAGNAVVDYDPEHDQRKQDSHE